MRIAGGIQLSTTFKVLAGVFITVSLLFAQDKAGRDTDVTRATLDNGLRVVIVRDPLAPVVTVEQNYVVGANETPDGFPGMAHAQEHMAFRGCSSLSADQTSAIFAQLGGFGNADTQQNITQYFSTVPAADLDIALRVNADCMRDIQDAQSEWAQEKPAIEQEVARDLSNPTYKFTTRLNEDMFSGTVYSHDALGTKESFDATTGEMLKDFYKKWYAPNNAILVIAGDVDPSRDAGEGQGVLRKHTQEITTAAARDQSATGKAGIVHVGQQSTLSSGVCRFPDAWNRQPGFRGGANFGRRSIKPTGQFVCDGSPGQGSANRIRICGGICKG